MTTLSRRSSCAVTSSSVNGTFDCADRVTCEHLSEDLFLYRGNVFVRAGEIFIVMLNSYLRTQSMSAGMVQELETLLQIASDDECHKITRCREDVVQLCLAIV